MSGDIMETWVPVVVGSIVTALATVLASGGFWAWLHRRDTAKSATSRLLMGVAYYKIQQLGLAYIDRGWISGAEYEDFRKYFFEPYRDLGGNGVAEQIMQQVNSLPIRSTREIAFSTIVEVKKGEDYGAV